MFCVLSVVPPPPRAALSIELGQDVPPAEAHPFPDNSCGRARRSGFGRWSSRQAHLACPLLKAVPSFQYNLTDLCVLRILREVPPVPLERGA